MPSRLSDAHIEAQARLRAAAAAGVAGAWVALDSWDRENIDEFLVAALPVVLAAQRTSVALTEAYIARFLDRQPIGLNPEPLLGAAVRGGVRPSEVYARPFVTLWSGLRDGRSFQDAFAAAGARARASAAVDVQLSMRATAGAVQGADRAIHGYRRVADASACKFCREVDGAFVKSATAMPLHNHCGCGLEPVTEAADHTTELPPGVAVHEHGELGPVLTDPAHDFTTEALALG